ncbi:MAG: tetratricopeptide repeat protein [Myxococcota bacterium]
MASSTPRAFFWGVAALVGAGLGAGLASLWPRAETQGLVQLAEKLESGRWRNLEAVLETELPVTPTLLGLQAEARAQMWSAFLREPVARAAALRVLHEVPQPWNDAAWLAHALTSSIAAPGVPPLTPKGRVAEALLAEREGRPEAALILLVDAARRSPLRRNTQLALARMHIRRGAWSAARDVLDALMDELPTDPVIWALNARARIRLKEAVRTVPAFQGLAPPESALVLSTQALIAAEQGRFDEAARSVDALDETFPRRGAFLLWAGRSKDAEAVFAESGDALGIARARFTRRATTCGLKVLSGRVLIDGEVLSIGRLRPGEWPSAELLPNPDLFPEQLYRAADPQDPRALGAANRVGLARICLAAGEAGRATRYLERAAKIEGDLVRPELRARALLEAGRPRTALSVLVRIPEADRSPMQRLWFARALRARGRMEDALGQLELVAVDEEVLAPSVLRLTASLQWMLGRSPLALERLRLVAPGDVGGTLLAALVVDDAPELSPRALAAFIDEPGWLDLPPAARIAGSQALWPRQPKRAERELRALILGGENEAQRALGSILWVEPERREEGQALLAEYLEAVEEGPGADAVRSLLGLQ